jgi:hypothetical protein
MRSLVKYGGSGKASGVGTKLRYSRQGKQPIGAGLDDRLHLRWDRSAWRSRYNPKAKFESDSRI